MAIEENNSEEDVIGMMTISDSETEDDPSHVSISNMKENIHAMSMK